MARGYLKCGNVCVYEIQMSAVVLTVPAAFDESLTFELTYQDCRHITLHASDGRMFIVKGSGNTDCIKNTFLYGFEPYKQIAVFHALQCLFFKKQRIAMADAAVQERLDALDNFSLSVVKIVGDVNTTAPDPQARPFDNVVLELELKWTQNGEPQITAPKEIRCTSISPAQFAHSIQI